MAKGGLLSLETESPIVSRVVASTADLGLVIDGEGIIREVLAAPGFESSASWQALTGQRWVDTVARDSAPKVQQLLTDAVRTQSSRAREINQRVEGLGEILFRFSAVRLDDDERVLALGRDMRPLTLLQQRMVSAQQTMERDYSRLRQADTRYRLLFHVSTEGVVIADAATRRVAEANPAAAAMLGEHGAALQSKTIAELFDASSGAAVASLLSAVEAGARTAPIRAVLQTDQVANANVGVSAFLFRQSGVRMFLVRFWSTANASTTETSRSSRMAAMLDALPDAFVVTGEDRRVLCANSAFCDLVQRANENLVIGEPLDNWLGRPGVDLNIMMANLREHRTVKGFATIVRADFGPDEEALVTAVSALDGQVPCLAFMIRSVSSRRELATEPIVAASAAAMPRSVEQLRELVGRVSLKELVQEAADMIERLCIVAALDVSGNNRASAAQLLGLSRQGLYSKMRRHALAEFGSTA